MTHRLLICASKTITITNGVKNQFMNKFLLASVLLMLPLPVVAHQLKTNGEVGALMHIEPADQPKVGTNQTIWFKLVKKGGQKIAADQCNCTLSLTQGPRSILDTPLTAGTSGENAGFPTAQLIFPHPGGYTLVVSGTPKGTAPKFTPFSLRWAVKVRP